jgi:hypothetical protein
MPDELNSLHELVLVASSLDVSTERVVKYLAEHHNVKINAIFFRVFRDGEREYLSRAWLNDPATVETSGPDAPAESERNGEYYVSFGAGPHRDWEDAAKYGFIAAGCGSWYSDTLSVLEPGARVWVNLPGEGYVGVGVVTESVVKIDRFLVKDGDPAGMSPLRKCR